MSFFGLQIDFTTVTAIATMILFFEEAIDRFWNLDGVASQVRTLGIGVLIGEIGAYFNLGMFSDPLVVGSNVWYVSGLAVGIFSTITANLAFLTPLAKAILELLKIRPKNK